MIQRQQSRPGWIRGVCGVLVLTGIALAGTPVRADLKIVEQGRSTYKIVVDKDAFPATLLAATELQQFVERATGAQLPIVAPARRGEHAIVIAHAESLPRESFAINVVGNDLIIRGHDSPGDPKTIDYDHPVSTGTLSGVYEFLERRLGVRFYWPDALGTIVPRHKSLTVESCLSLTQSPHFALRRLWAGPGYVDNFTEDASKIWGRRLRLGASRPYRYYHTWFRMLNVAEWAAKGHPEYAALVDGKRQTHYGTSRSQGGQLCISNPDVQRIIIDAVKASKDPMVAISPNDGYGEMCMCANCRLLDSGRAIPDGKLAGKPDLSDRIMWFYNLVARESGRVVGGYAYNDFVEVPSRTKLHEDVYVAVALNNGYLTGHPVESARAERLCRAWGKFSPKATAYDIFYTVLKMDDYIAPLGTDVERRIRLIADSGLSGALLYIATEMERGGADAYVAAKLLWDPRADGAAIRKAYYRDLYGPAGVLVEQFYERAAAQWRVAAQAYPAKKRTLSNYAQVFPELNELLSRAEHIAGDDPAVRQRMARLRQAYQEMVE